jgi:hypothetical protein
MSNNRTSLMDAIELNGNCKATYVHTQPVRIILEGKVLWKGRVEVFDLKGHAFSKRAFGWTIRHKEKKSENIIVMGIPPLDTPLMAVKAFLASRKLY